MDDRINEKITLLLRTGAMLMTHGANSNRVKRNLRRAGEVFGMEKRNLHFHLSIQSIMISYKADDEYICRFENLNGIGVDMQIISGVSRMLWQALKEQYSIEQYAEELDRLSNLPKQYKRGWVIFWVGLACVSFCRLMGGDLSALIFTQFATSVALFVRQELHQRGVNNYLNVGISATIASALASLNAFLPYSSTPNQAVIASVLFLIPGVPLINSIDDILDGYALVGFSRALVGIMIVFAISLGMVFILTSAMRIYSYDF